MTSEYPENFSRFYDSIYRSLRDGVDNRFYLEKILKTGGKSLEIGTGTGRFFISALESGADIYGIDISRNMVDVLHRKIKKEQHDRISIQNIVDFSFDFRFDIIIAPFRVLMHIHEKQEQLIALNNVYKHLKPGGRFIFDVFAADLAKLIRGIDSVVDFEGEYEPGRKLKRTVSTNPDPFNQLIHVHFRLDWEEADGEKHEDWDTALRYLFRFELEHLLERSDFGHFEIYGGFDGQALSENSVEYVVECTRTR